MASKHKHSVSRDLGTSLHHQVATVMRDSIASGRYQQGDLLPSESALCKMFAVSRVTVRRAMQALEEQGLIERRQGSGTFVGQSPAAHLLRASMETYLQRNADFTAKTSVRVEAYDVIPPPDAVRDLLHLKKREEVLRVVRVRARGQQPVMQVTAYLPADIGNQIPPEDFITVSLADLMERAGHGYHRADLTLRAALADPLVAGRLQVPVGSPLLMVLRVMFDQDDRPVEYIVALAPPERYEMHVTLRVDGAGRWFDTDTDDASFRGMSFDI